MGFFAFFLGMYSGPSGPSSSSSSAALLPAVLGGWVLLCGSVLELHREAAGETCRGRHRAACSRKHWHNAGVWSHRPGTRCAPKEEKHLYSSMMTYGPSTARLMWGLSLVTCENKHRGSCRRQLQCLFYLSLTFNRARNVNTFVFYLSVLSWLLSRRVPPCLLNNLIRACAVAHIADCWHLVDSVDVAPPWNSAGTH